MRIAISDDGPGIPPEIQRRIFDPFFTTKEVGQGTGLGLTICYSIIDEHGGRIWTENLPNSGGAVFNIELPIREAEEPGRASDRRWQRLSAASVRQRPARPRGRRRAEIRLLLHDILRLDKHDVALASSGVEAADLLERERFDIILTDMKMPGMDGADLYRSVRRARPCPGPAHHLHHRRHGKP